MRQQDSKMKSIILKQREVLQLLCHGKVCVVRPMVIKDYPEHATLVKPEWVLEGEAIFIESHNPVGGGTVRINAPWLPCSVLWVRETWAAMLPAPISDWPIDKRRECCIYRSTHRNDRDLCWRSSSTMPRWASRLNVKVVGVTAKMVKDATKEDASLTGACGVFGDRKSGCRCRMCALEDFFRLWPSDFPDHHLETSWAWFGMMERCDA